MLIIQNQRLIRNIIISDFKVGNFKQQKMWYCKKYTIIVYKAHTNNKKLQLCSILHSMLTFTTILLHFLKVYC